MPKPLTDGLKTTNPTVSYDKGATSMGKSVDTRPTRDKPAPTPPKLGPRAA